MNRVRLMLWPRRLLCQKLQFQNQVARESQLTWLKAEARKTTTARYHYRIVSDKLRQDILVPTLDANRRFIKSDQRVLANQFDALMRDSSNRQLQHLIQSMSKDSLVGFITYLATVENSTEIYSKQWYVAEQQLAYRINQIDERTLLYMADTMYTSDYRPSRFLHSLSHCWAIKWDQLDLSPSDIVHLLFYLGVNRSSPIELMAMCEIYIEKNIDKFSGPQLSVICYSFFNSNTAFRSFATIASIADATLKELPSISVNMLTNILKALRHASFKNVAFFETIGDALCQENLKQEKYLSTLTHLVYPFASVGIQHKDLFSHVMSAACQIVESGKYRSKDLIKIIWSYTTLQQPVSPSLAVALISDLRSNPSLATYREVFVEGVVSLVMAGNRPMDLISRVLANEKRQGKGMLWICVCVSRICYLAALI